MILRPGLLGLFYRYSHVGAVQRNDLLLMYRHEEKSIPPVSHGRARSRTLNFGTLVRVPVRCLDPTYRILATGVHWPRTVSEKVIAGGMLLSQMDRRDQVSKWKATRTVSTHPRADRRDRVAVRDGFRAGRFVQRYRPLSVTNIGLVVLEMRLPPCLEMP